MIWIVAGVVILVAGPIVARRFEGTGGGDFDPFKRRRGVTDERPDRGTTRDAADPDKLPPFWRRRPH